MWWLNTVVCITLLQSIFSCCGGCVLQPRVTSELIVAKMKLKNKLIGSADCPKRNPVSILIEKTKHKQL